MLQPGHSKYKIDSKAEQLLIMVIIDLKVFYLRPVFRQAITWTSVFEAHERWSVRGGCPVDTVTRGSFY